MYSLTHFFAVVGREMTAGGSTQMFSLCWASLSSVHTPTSTPLCLYLTVSGSLPPRSAQFYFVKGRLDPLCVCVQKLWDAVSLQGANITHTHKCVSFQVILCVFQPCVLKQADWSHDTRLPSFFLHTHSLQFPCIPGNRCSALEPGRRSAGLHWNGHFYFLFPTFVPAGITVILKQVIKWIWKKWAF